MENFRRWIYGQSTPCSCHDHGSSPKRHTELFSDIRFLSSPLSHQSKDGVALETRGVRRRCQEWSPRPRSSVLAPEEEHVIDEFRRLT